MVEIETMYILGAVGAGVLAILTRLEMMCKSVDKLKALARIVHPKESEQLKL